MSDEFRVEKSKKSNRKPGSGRVRGVPNKATRDLFELCEREGVDVFQGLLRFCSDPDKNIAFNAHKEAAKYLYPTRKAVEMNANIIDVEEREKRIAAKREELRLLHEAKTR